MILHFQMGYSKRRVFFGVIRSLAVPVLLGTSLIARIVKGILCSGQKNILYNYKPVPLLVYNYLPSEYKDKHDSAQHVMMTLEERTSRLLCVREQTTLPIKWEEVVLAAKYAKELVQIGPLTIVRHYSTTNDIHRHYPRTPESVF